MTKRTKSDRRREQILKMAVEIFDRKGYSNTSLEDIAHATGISREAIYYYFKNRSDILLAIVKPSGEEIVENMRALIASDRDPREKLLMAIENHIGRFENNPLEMTLSLRDIYTNEIEEIRPQLNPVWRQYLWLWTDLISSGQQAGVFMQNANPKIIAFGILGMCNWMGRWFNPRKPASVAEIIATFSEMISFGIFTEGEADSPWIRDAVETGKKRPPQPPPSGDV